MGIFGGTFDPIHVGHLLVAETASEELDLDEVRFLPAAVSPLKVHQTPRSTAKQRGQMVRLAIGGNPRFCIDEREIERGGTSYTIDTLRELRDEYPNTQLVFLMGADSLKSFHLWKEPRAICELAEVVVLMRGGHENPDKQLLAEHLPSTMRRESHLEKHVLNMPQIEISSSDLRERFAQGRSTRYQLHPAVEAYIEVEGLYLPDANGGKTKSA